MGQSNGTKSRLKLNMFNCACCLDGAKERCPAWNFTAAISEYAECIEKCISLLGGGGGGGDLQNGKIANVHCVLI